MAYVVEDETQFGSTLLTTNEVGYPISRAGDTDAPFMPSRYFSTDLLESGSYPMSPGLAHRFNCGETYSAVLGDASEYSPLFQDECIIEIHGGEQKSQRDKEGLPSDAPMSPGSLFSPSEFRPFDGFDTPETVEPKFDDCFFCFQKKEVCTCATRSNTPDNSWTTLPYSEPYVTSAPSTQTSSASADSFAPKSDISWEIEECVKPATSTIECGNSSATSAERWGPAYRRHPPRTGGFPCQYCEKVFDRHRDQKRHETIHGKRPYVCTDCGKDWVYVKDLRRHERSHHTDHTDLRCTVCNRRFSRLDNLRRHIKLVHPLEKGNAVKDLGKT